MAKNTITLNEEQLRKFLSRSVRKVVKEKWEKDYQDMLDGQAYDKYRNQNFLKRGVDIVRGKRPNKPAGYKRNEPMDDRASRYVQSFNDEHGTGKRMDFGDGTSSHVGMRYQADTHEPVLSHTEYDGNTGYSERYFYGKNGLDTVEGPGYPASEFSVNGRYKNSGNPAIDNQLKKFDTLHGEVDNVTRNARRLNEGTTDQHLLDVWDKMIELLGADAMLNWLWNCMSTDDIDSNLRWIDRNEGLGLFDDDGEGEDEYYEGNDEETEF